MEPQATVSKTFSPFKLMLDAALTVGLFSALALIFLIDHFAPSTPQVIELTEAPAEESKPSPARRALRLGVTPDVPEFDDIGKLLKELGEGYKFQTFSLEELSDPARVAEFDVIFLCCSGVPRSWLNNRIGDSKREGVTLFTPNERALSRVSDTLRQFVGRGGTLYASDLHYSIVTKAFPEFIDSATDDTVTAQSLTADVVDEGLRELIGERLPLKFDQGGWRPAAFAGDKLTTMLRGKYRTADGETRAAPLLVKFPHMDGTVIFTSFHNEKQNNETELQLLRYLVFTAVTADVESQVNKSMVRGGFSPSKRNLFSASAAEPSVAKVYRATKKGDLQFVLGFQNLGAKLKLTVVGPDGKRLEKEGTQTITISVRDAEIGDWTYTVTAIEIPNENFPFTVTVGQK